jgi:uncharacterized protein (TIGR02145 family)
MKPHSISFLIAFFIFQVSFSLHAQAPESFTYQAVVRNSSGQPLANQQVSLRISILKGGEFGAFVYVETHEGMTNKFGLITKNIGTGNVVSGDFGSINWSDGPYYLKIEIDATGGNSYSDMGTSPLLSVPYAMVAKTVENGFSISYNNLQDKPAGIDEDKTDDVLLMDDQLVQGTKSFGNTVILYNGADATNNPIINVATPINSGDAVNKAYVDKLISRIEELDARIDKLERIIYPPDTAAQDIESNIYKLITIGDQVWMAEDLRTTKYNDGSPIDNITDASEWVSLSSPAYCWYMNDEIHKIPNGALYNWYAVNTGKLCPVGWHVPGDSEWKTLEMALGMSQNDADQDGWRGTDEGNKLKSTTGWISGSGTNESGFSAIAGGLRDWDDAAFYWLGYYSHWWTSTEGDSYSAWDRDVSYTSTAIFRYPNSKNYGMSVRCLKN